MINVLEFQRLNQDSLEELFVDYKDEKDVKDNSFWDFVSDIVYEIEEGIMVDHNWKLPE